MDSASDHAYQAETQVSEEEPDLVCFGDKFAYATNPPFSLLFFDSKI